MILFGRKIKKRIKICLFIFLFLWLFVIIVKGMDIFIMPRLVEISGMEMKTLADEIIDEAVRKSINEGNITASSFYKFEDNAVLYADTMLINKFCAEVNTKLDDSFKKLENEKVRIPIGAFTGISMLANSGPEIGIKMVYMDDSSVDYETSFQSGGINQINYKVWLNIDIQMRLVNPLLNGNIDAQRKVMLIDTVIKGDVPDTYLGIEN